MNILFAAAMLSGIILGVTAISSTRSLFLPYAGQKLSQLEIQEKTALPLVGTIKEITTDSILIEEAVRRNIPPRYFHIQYDTKTLMLLRLQNFEGSTITAARLVIAPKEDVLAIGSQVRVNVRVTKEKTRPYAISVLTPPLQ